MHWMDSARQKSGLPVLQTTPNRDYDNAIPGLIDPATVSTGQSVRMFEVTMSQFLFVTSIVRELTPGVDYVAVPASASQIAILPLKPLKEYTSYMAVLTNDIRDTEGNDATPDRTYNFGKTSVPWVDEMAKHQSLVC